MTLIWSLLQKGCTLVALGRALCHDRGDHFSAEDTKLEHFRSERKLEAETHTQGCRSGHQVFLFPSLSHLNPHGDLLKDALSLRGFTPASD